MKSVPIAFLLLAACGQQTASPPSNEANAAAPATATKPAEPAAKAFVYDEKNDLLDYHFEWSAEAAAVPELVARFKADLDKDKAKLLASAKEDKAYRDKQDYPFNQYSSSTKYETAGQSDRLLSLTINVGAYTGGAHGNYGTNALLWDRQAKKEIKIADLFTEQSNMSRLLIQRWCDALNRAREEKRGEPVGGGGMFDDCPPLSDIAIVPTDKDKNGRFERLILTASPYVAGSYAEGSYEIDLAATPDLVAGLKADYRPSFEAQTQ